MALVRLRAPPLELPGGGREGGALGGEEKKGRFVVRGEPNAGCEVGARAFAGEPVEYAMRDARTGRYFACVTSAFYGPKLFFTDDPSREGEQAQGLELPEDAGEPLVRLWTG